MFSYRDGLFLSGIELALDLQRRHSAGFISHAHADHCAAHDLIYCTPATAALLAHRFAQCAFQSMPYGMPLERSDVRLTTWPAGHMLGSAMLLVESNAERLLYTGDFRLRESATAEPAPLVSADTLIMECTYGRACYRFPPRSQVTEQLIDCVQTSLKFGQTPVIEAYAFGKAQEVTRLLTRAGIGVVQHPMTYMVSKIYEQLGCELGPFRLFGRCSLEGAAVVRPPHAHHEPLGALPRRRREIRVTGWALEQPRYRPKLSYDFPFSDHADYDELIECVERVEPRKVYCFHGQREFVNDLRDRGWNAEWLERGEGRGARGESRKEVHKT